MLSIKLVTTPTSYFEKNLMYTNEKDDDTIIYCEKSHLFEILSMLTTYSGLYGYPPPNYLI